MDIIGTAAKDYVLDISRKDGKNTELLGDVKLKDTYLGVEQAFVAGAEWILDRFPIFLVPPCKMPEDIFQSNTDDTLYATTKEYIIFYKRKGYDIAYREWSKDDPVWRWRIKYGRIVDDEDILCWMQRI